MKINTSELEGAALDWAVQKVLNSKPDSFLMDLSGDDRQVRYSLSWELAGPLIEMRLVEITPVDKEMGRDWQAQTWTPYACQRGPSPLIAAMRAIVASDLGDEVDVPEELS